MAISKNHVDMDITLNNEKLEQVSECVYLGSQISEDKKCDQDIKRSSLASAVVGKLGRIWRSYNISTKTKIKVYESLVIPVLLYGSECWNLE